MDERTALLHFLDAQRRSVVAIVDGLSPRELRRSVVPTGRTSHRMVDHLDIARELLDGSTGLGPR